VAITLTALAVAVVLFVTMLFLEFHGYKRGRAWTASHAGVGHKGAGAVEAAVYGLLGLLLALSFSGAASRFDLRRAQIVDEANAVGTAYLRVDLLPAEAQPGLRDTFRAYVDSRIKTYKLLPDVGAAEVELARSVSLQGKLWKEAVAASRTIPPPDAIALLSALNTMFDVASTRVAAAYTHPPAVLYVIIVLLALVSAYLVGHGMAEDEAPSRRHMVAYAAALAIVLYVVIDLEFPRFGLIHLSGYDYMLEQARAGMS
jgi:hypothetical protein